MRIADNARGCLSVSCIVRLAYIVSGVELKKIVVEANIKADRSLSIQQSVNVAFALGIRFPIAGLKSIVCFRDKKRRTGGQSETSSVAFGPGPVECLYVECTKCNRDIAAARGDLFTCLSTVNFALIVCCYIFL